MKRLIVLGANVVLTCQLAVAAVSSATYGGHTWFYEVVSSSAKTAKLSPRASGLPCVYEASVSGEVEIPSALDGYTVTTIGADAFLNCKKITKISIPSTVKYVYGAFRNCTILETVSVGSDAITFYDSAFTNCPVFTAFESTSSNYAVEKGLLYNADKTELVYCPIALASVELASTTAKIKSRAFDHSAVTTLTLSPAVATLAYDAFVRATGLQAFAVNAANPNFAAVDGVLYDHAVKTLVKVPATKTALIVSVGITNVADYACYTAYALKSISLPGTLRRVSTTAFVKATPRITAYAFGGAVPENLANCTDFFLNGSTSYSCCIEHQSVWKSFFSSHSITRNITCNYGLMFAIH